MVGKNPTFRLCQGIGQISENVEENLGHYMHYCHQRVFSERTNNTYQEKYPGQKKERKKRNKGRKRKSEQPQVLATAIKSKRTTVVLRPTDFHAVITKHNLKLYCTKISLYIKILKMLPNIKNSIKTRQPLCFWGPTNTAV